MDVGEVLVAPVWHGRCGSCGGPEVCCQITLYVEETRDEMKRHEETGPFLMTGHQVEAGLSSFRARGLVGCGKGAGR